MYKERVKHKRKRRPRAIEELIADVVAFNKYLKPVAREMSVEILLANCHPLYRGDHRRIIEQKGLMEW